MKRLFTALVIVIVVLLAGLSALIILINPNSFRAEIARQVEQSTGYQVVIDGDLRWHVWPQLSILAGRVTITAPQASQPLITADNLRLDVRLLPLLSHQLSIEQVLLKGAIIRLTSDRKKQQVTNVPSPPSQTTIRNESQGIWNWNINTVEIVDGVLVWQKGGSDQLNARDLNLLFTRQAKNQANLQASSTISRDQKELKLSLNSELEIDPQADNYTAKISELSYQLQGAGIPQQGIQGTANLQLDYQGARHLLRVNAMNLEYNDAQLQGQGSINLQQQVPEITLNLSAPEFRIGAAQEADSEQSQEENKNQADGTQSGKHKNGGMKGTNPEELATLLDNLKGFNANIQLKIDNFVYKGTEIKLFAIDIENRQGQLKLSKLAGSVFGGQIDLNGTMQPAEQNYKLDVQSSLQNIQLQPMLDVFNLPAPVTGRLTLQGKFQHRGTDFALKTWQAEIQSKVNNARLNGINIQQIIQQSAERINSGIKGREKYERYTEVREIQADGKLRQGGSLQLKRLAADSQVLQLAGAGELNVSKQMCDLELQVKVKGDWRGKPELVRLLSDMQIPMKIYGPWNNLQYRVEVDKLLQEQLKSRGKELLNELLRRDR